ncbi:Methylglyoxal synthase [Stanieria cyanosphaera PCC 7437]|uniref:Methylglyoxal synthase n=1 Tax=Stanieria cyanosphaera (strain ATCC 29371 / PCC 7437) TaxID=111780 RepID=K9XXY5_STAC7|nr:methylglyoxal synthase [Stanieria cyanosphaera]AFZ36919.1 Methylglyoxal synthase [Stanieria cyanosphaera PCC 7437]
MARKIALIAHDRKKDDIVAFVSRHAPVLSRYHLIATGTTGERIETSSNLSIERMESGPIGGDTQIAAQIVAGEVVGVIFLIDPLYAQPHEPDIQALLRVCNVHNVALATNLATAEAFVASLANSVVAHLIYNPVSGQGDGQQELDLIKELLEPHLHLEVHLTTPDLSPQQLAENALTDRPDLIIASGGDGTVSAVAGAVIGTDIPLGVIPRGTANAFAMALGITQQLNQIRRACEIILAGYTRIIDAAFCNDLPLILLAGVGYEAEIIEKADREAKNRWGSLAYIMAGWQQLNEHMLFDAEIELEGEIRQFQAGAITVANVAPPTSVLAQGIGEVIVDDGLLDVTITTAATKLQAVTTMLGMLGGALIKTNTELENVVHLKAKKLRLAAQPPQKVVLDGEIIGTTPLEIRCIPQGLKVFVPKPI